MLRIKRFITLSTGWCKKIRITLSTVTSSVIIKTKSKCSVYFDVLATNQCQKMILCLQMARMNLCLRYENVECALKIETDRAELFLALIIEF